MVRFGRVGYSQPIHRPAIRASHLTGLGDIEEHPRVAVPQLHASLGVRAVDAAVGVQVGSGEFDDGGGGRGRGGHGRVHTRVSQWAYLGLRPLTMSKNAL